MMDMEEYRLLNGWSNDKKKGSSRFDRIPMALVEEVEINCPGDYMQFVPYDLPEQFTTKDFAKAMKEGAEVAYKAVIKPVYLD